MKLLLEPGASFFKALEKLCNKLRISSQFLWNKPQENLKEKIVDHCQHLLSIARIDRFW
jgi:hypothetical protein